MCIQAAILLFHWGKANAIFYSFHFQSMYLMLLYVEKVRRFLTTWIKDKGDVISLSRRLQRHRLLAFLPVFMKRLPIIGDKGESMEIPIIINIIACFIKRCNCASQDASVYRWGTIHRWGTIQNTNTSYFAHEVSIHYMYMFSLQVSYLVYFLVFLMY